MSNEVTFFAYGYVSKGVTSQYSFFKVMSSHDESALKQYFKNVRHSIMLFYLWVRIYRAIKWLFSTPSRQAYTALKWQIIGMQDRVKRWNWFLWWNWCNLFNSLFSRTIRILYLLKILFLKVIFILISMVLLVEISNSCVSGVATENICSFFISCGAA